MLPIGYDRERTALWPIKVRANGLVSVHENEVLSIKCLPGGGQLHIIPPRTHSCSNLVPGSDEYKTAMS